MTILYNIPESTEVYLRFAINQTPPAHGVSIPFIPQFRTYSITHTHSETVAHQKDPQKKGAVQIATRIYFLLQQICRGRTRRGQYRPNVTAMKICPR